MPEKPGAKEREGSVGKGRPSLSYGQIERCLFASSVLPPWLRDRWRQCVRLLICYTFGRRPKGEMVNTPMFVMLQLVSGINSLYLFVNLILLTNSSIADTPIPSSITSSSFDSPLCSSTTHSLFHSRLKTYPFHKSYPSQFHFFLPN